MAAEGDMIKQIRIQNFRSLVDVTVDLDPLTVLIGRSGTGKSNFVHAIRFLRDSLNSRSINFVRGISHVDHHNDLFGYNLRFSIDQSNPDYHYSLLRPNTGHLDESLRIGDRVLYHHAE